jgi:putative nucleotidyltransferase with HDIG domain
MDEKARREFRADVIARKSLPTIPTTLATIITLVGDDRAGARKLVGLVEQDQALAARLLRLANSAFFGQARKVTTIPRAVLLLGFSTVRNLALGVKVWETLGTGVTRAEVDRRWRHAVEVAVVARVLARRLGQVSPDEAFTAGLLHDIGQLLLAMRLKEHYWAIVRSATPTDDLAMLEQSSLGIDHAEVGAWLLESWNLPPLLVDGVRRHHDLEVRAGLAWIVGAASRLVNRTGIVPGDVAPEASPVLSELGLSEDDWSGMVVEIDRSGAAAALREAR